jgi:TolB protein
MGRLFPSTFETAGGQSTAIRGLTLTTALALLAACASPPNAPTTAVPTIAVTPGATVTASHAPVSGQIVFFDFPAGAGKSQIYIEAADGTNVRKLLSSTFDDRSPSLSPDGRRVAFTRYVADGAPLDPGGVFVVNVDGTGLTQLDIVGEDAAWSPDGKQIVDTHALFDPGAAAPYNVALWVMNADGSHKHQITLVGKRCDNACAGGEQHNEGVWSPDGKRIAFKRDVYTSPEHFSIYTVAADGTDPRRVTPEGMDVGDPAWSPDGTLIAFQSPPEANSGGEQNIYTIHPDGSGIRQLTAHLSSSDGTQGTFHPSWSPDGSMILFSHDPGTTGRYADIFVMNADGSDVHVVAGTPLNENWANWGVTPQS